MAKSELEMDNILIFQNLIKPKTSKCFKITFTFWETFWMKLQDHSKTE